MSLCLPDIPGQSWLVGHDDDDDDEDTNERAHLYRRRRRRVIHEKSRAACKSAQWHLLLFRCAIALPATCRALAARIKFLKGFFFFARSAGRRGQERGASVSREASASPPARPPACMAKQFDGLSGPSCVADESGRRGIQSAPGRPRSDLNDFESRNDRIESGGSGGDRNYESRVTFVFALKSL